MSGGQKKLLELGRTMMVDARVVFIDEAGAGVNRTLLRTIGDAIIRLNKERNYTFCMIEHDFAFISRLCETVIVHGRGQAPCSRLGGRNQRKRAGHRSLPWRERREDPAGCRHQ